MTTTSPTSSASPRPSAGPDIVVGLEGITKVYYKPDGSVLVEALRGVDVGIQRGEYVAIMGASGSGKSTMMNVLGCLDRPTAGRYMLAGRDVSTLEDEELSHIRGAEIGFVFQAFNLISALTVLDNVQVPLFYQGITRKDREDRAKRMLAMVGLEDRMTHTPTELSGGQQQRVAVARALINEPSIILADEPTGNLDSKTGELILELFDNLHRDGMTVIMVTHDDNVADRCERVVRLHDGLVASDEVLRRTGILKSSA